MLYYKAFFVNECFMYFCHNFILKLFIFNILLTDLNLTAKINL